MNIIAIDLGTQCGWALGMGESTYHGSESFHPRKNDKPAQRWLKFRQHLQQIASQAPDIHAVYYEKVMRHGPAQVEAAHVYGGFEAMLQVWCELRGYPLYAVGVGTVKKAWTGKGNAKKPDMIAEAERRGFKVKDDNAADALAILHLARSIEGAEQPRPVAEAALERIDRALITTPFDR